METDLCATAGVEFGTVAEARGEGAGVAVGLATEFAVNAGAGLGLAFELELELVFRELFFAVVLEEFLFVSNEGEGAAGRLLALEFRFESDPRLGGAESRPALAAAAEFPPGTVKTTSSLFERCSTWAVVPGCSRNETTVLLPVRCVFTSAKPRPRRVSARGTSAAGILT